ncbi:MAG: hypothetical protein ACI8SJ_001510, partial [Shewanella sp.]
MIKTQLKLVFLSKFVEGNLACDSLLFDELVSNYPVS